MLSKKKYKKAKLVGSGCGHNSFWNSAFVSVWKVEDEAGFYVQSTDGYNERNLEEAAHYEDEAGQDWIDTDYFEYEQKVRVIKDGSELGLVLFDDDDEDDYTQDEEGNLIEKDEEDEKDEEE